MKKILATVLALTMALGGRVAEEIVIHDVSAGASNDIQKVTQMARKMVTEWGMSSRLGPIAYGNEGPVFLGRDFEQRNSYSEETAGIIDEEIKAIVESAYERAKKLLLEHRSILDNMARVLVERETIYTAEVDMLMKGASYEEVLSYMEEHDKNVPDRPFGVPTYGADNAQGTQTANENTETSSGSENLPAPEDEAKSQEDEEISRPDSDNEE